MGTVAIGTEGFMIAPLLPDLAADLSVGIGTAGQLVAVFALTYAVIPADATDDSDVTLCAASL